MCTKVNTVSEGHHYQAYEVVSPDEVFVMNVSKLNTSSNMYRGCQTHTGNHKNSGSFWKYTEIFLDILLDDLK